MSNCSAPYMLAAVMMSSQASVVVCPNTAPGMSLGLLSCLLLLQPNQQLPEGFSNQVFGSVYEQPLCSLYASRSDDEFSGQCDSLPTHCTRNATWCAGDSNPDAEAVQELMAMQLSKDGCLNSSNIPFLSITQQGASS